MAARKAKWGGYDDNLPQTRKYIVMNREKGKAHE